MTNIFKLHKQKPVRLGHKKVQDTKKKKMEAEGQLNLFVKPSPKILTLEKHQSPFEKALHLDKQNSKKAKEFYKEAIEKQDFPADAYCNLGILEAYDNNYIKAIDCFSRALIKEPRHFEAHFNLGNLYFDKEDLNLARLHYETALEIEPEDANIYFNLGLVQALQEDIQEAIKSLSSYAQMVGNEKAGKANELITNLSMTTT